jgi:hypothetical protein
VSNFDNFNAFVAWQKHYSFSIAQRLDYRRQLPLNSGFDLGLR